MPRGHQTSYTRELANAICEGIAAGQTLRETCRNLDIPHQSVRWWVIYDYEGFAGQYARARELQIENWADELVEIADDGSNDWIERNRGETTEVVLNSEHVQRSKLRSDNRKWLLSKLKPDRYGDRLEHVGAGGKDLIPERAADPDSLAKALMLAFKSMPQDDEPESKE